MCLLPSLFSLSQIHYFPCCRFWSVTGIICHNYSQCSVAHLTLKILIQTFPVSKYLPQMNFLAFCYTNIREKNIWYFFRFLKYITPLLKDDLSFLTLCFCLLLFFYHIFVFQILHSAWNTNGTQQIFACWRSQNWAQMPHPSWTVS